MVVSSRRSPRRSLLHLSVPKLWLLLAPMLVAGAYGLGFWHGRGHSPAPTAKLVPALAKTAALSKVIEQQPPVSRVPKVKKNPAETISATISRPLAVVGKIVEIDTSTQSQAPEPQEPPLPKYLKTLPRSGFGLQLGAFQSLTEAENFMRTHQAAIAGQDIYVWAASVRGKGTWYRVRLGRFPGMRSAQTALRQLPQDLASSAMVVRYR